MRFQLVKPRSQPTQRFDLPHEYETRSYIDHLWFRTFLIYHKLSTLYNQIAVLYELYEPCSEGPEAPHFVFASQTPCTTQALLTLCYPLPHGAAFAVCQDVRVKHFTKEINIT